MNNQAYFWKIPESLLYSICLIIFLAFITDSTADSRPETKFDEWESVPLLLSVLESLCIVGVLGTIRF